MDRCNFGFGGRSEFLEFDRVVLEELGDLEGLFGEEIAGWRSGLLMKEEEV